jgi:hypothetical protein
VSEYQQAQPSKIERITRAKKYAATHGLRIDQNGFYAYRNHDVFGRGQFQSARFYTSGRAYRDWHCDARPEQENSFGLGIWPTGNTRVFVRYEDFCVATNKNDGKARVWGFEMPARS